MAKLNEWMSVSDLMTGLMVIFLFITVAYMSRVRENENVLREYVETRQQLHDELKKEFDRETKKGELTLGSDLSMKFENAQSLFASGKSDLTDEFQTKLCKFLPRYLDILLNSDFADRIVEIRIEGHTDDHRFANSKNDPYIDNVVLSQQRALAVLKYMRERPFYVQLSQEKKKRLEFWFTANGFSYGKSLDKEGNFTYNSGKKIDDSKSRRVEFRIITKGEDVLVDFVKKNN